MKYYRANNMVSRIDKLEQLCSALPPGEVQRRLEKWDQDQGRATIQHAEGVLKKPPAKHAWSPKLRNAGTIKHYWRLRFREQKYAENHSISITRLEERIQRVDQHFYFPEKDRFLNLQEILSRLKSASLELRTIQKQSKQR